MDRTMKLPPDRFWSDRAGPGGRAQAVRVSAPRAATKGASSSSADPRELQVSSTIRGRPGPVGTDGGFEKAEPPVHGAAHRLPES